MPLSFSSIVSNSVARLSKRKVGFLSGVTSCLMVGRALRSPNSSLEERTAKAEVKGKGTLGTRRAIRSEGSAITGGDRWRGHSLRGQTAELGEGRPCGATAGGRLTDLQLMVPRTEKPAGGEAAVHLPGTCCRRYSTIDSTLGVNTGASDRMLGREARVGSCSTTSAVTEMGHHLPTCPWSTLEHRGQIA